MWGVHGGFGWWMIVDGFLWLVLLAVVVYLVARVLSPHDWDEPTALEIARRRYARGELTRAEFEQLRRDLAATPGGGA